MNKTNKIFQHTLRGLGILLVVLLIFVLLSPVLINMDPVKDKILTYLSEKTEGKLLYKKVDILYFPRPHAVIHQAIVSLPGDFKGKIARLNVYPAIFPLFTGDVRIKKLRIRTPNLELKLPLRENKRNEQTNTLLIQPVKKALIDSCKYFLANLPNTAIQIQNGSLTIYDESRSVFNFQNINAHTKISSKKIKIDLMGKSNLWKNIAVNGWINPQIFTCKGQVSVTHFSPKKLTDFIFPDADWKIADGDINFDLDFQSYQPNLVRARVQCRKSHLTWLHGDDKIAIKATRLMCKLDMDDERTQVYLSNLTLGYPKLSASGQLILNRMTDQISLDIDAKKLDVGSTRKVALTLAENKGITRDIFDIVRDGKIPEISFKSFGKSLADLGKLENIFLKG
ncbi:MAG: AsmA family protein, partial [Deltaproteobacteria bacterium]|nr:AsmA family protein [Deltaproteobacteria bacterium]